MVYESILVFILFAAFNKSEFQEGARIEVQKIKGKPVPASLVQLKGDDFISVNNEDHLLALCKSLYSKRILMLDSHVTVPFYGKHFYLKVKDILPTDILPDENEDLLTKQLEMLNINKSLTKNTYYVVVETTKWSLVKNVGKKGLVSEVTEKNSKLIGGYKEVTKELSTTISLVLKRNSSSSSKKSYCLHYVLCCKGGWPLFII